MPIIKSKITKLSDIPDMPKAQLKKLLALKDEDIDTSDIPELTEEWFKKAKVIKPNNKVVKTIRFNKDVIEFVQKKQGKGYQTLINDIVEEWAKHHGMKHH
jgi:uncharacterized protein (DUF4415 family)